MNVNTFLILILIVWILGIACILYLKHIKKSKYESVEPSEEEIRVLHIFPDYTKNMPYECNPGEKLRFVVKGYTDVNEIREVPINGNKVVWKHTKGNGEFRRNRDLKTGIYSGTYIDFIITEITNPYDKEKLIFVSAHYLSLTDATWIKVVR